MIGRFCYALCPKSAWSEGPRQRGTDGHHEPEITGQNLCHRGGEGEQNPMLKHEDIVKTSEVANRSRRLLFDILWLWLNLHYKTIDYTHAPKN